MYFFFVQKPADTSHNITILVSYNKKKINLKFRMMYLLPLMNTVGNRYGNIFVCQNGGLWMIKLLWSANYPLHSALHRRQRYTSVISGILASTPLHLHCFLSLLWLLSFRFLLLLLLGCLFLPCGPRFLSLPLLCSLSFPLILYLLLSLGLLTFYQ